MNGPSCYKHSTSWSDVQMLFFHLLPGISETVQNRNIKVDKITQQNKIVSVEKYVLRDSNKKKKVMLQL